MKIKSILPFFILFLLLVFHSGPFIGVFAAETEVVDRIVAVVNDDIILLSELMLSFRPYEQRIKSAGYTVMQEEKARLKVREDLLNQMIDDKLTDQEIKRTRIFVSEAEIDSAIERLKKINNYTDEELLRMLAGQGFTIETYRHRMKEQILRSRLVNKEVKSKIVITKEDIKSYYNEHPEIYGGETQYHLRNLMMKISLQTGDMENQYALKRMNSILEKMKAGEPFDKSDTIGRDLGLIGFNKLSPQLQTVLKSLKPGEFTPVLDTDSGYQIFFVQDIVKSSGIAFEEVSEEIERKLYDKIVNREFKDWLGMLRKRSHIKIIE